MPKGTEEKGLEEENSCAIWGTYISVFFFCVCASSFHLSTSTSLRPGSRVRAIAVKYMERRGVAILVAAPPIYKVDANWSNLNMFDFINFLSSLCCFSVWSCKKKENVVLAKLACDWSLFVRLSILLIRLLFLSIYGTCVYRLTCLFHQRADRPPFDLFGTKQSPTRVSTSFILLLFLCFVLGCFFFLFFISS